MKTLATTPALCAYGGGAGSYTSIAGLGNSDSYHDVVTTELVSNDVKTVFALLFGSWLGASDSEDNLLRGLLALPSFGLASALSGRPHWKPIRTSALGLPSDFGLRNIGFFHSPVGLCLNPAQDQSRCNIIPRAAS